MVDASSHENSSHEGAGAQASPSPAASVPPWRSIALFLLTALAVVTCVLFSNVLLFSLAGAVTLAVVTNPLAGWLKRRCSPSVSAAILVILVCVAIFLPLVLILRELVGELMSLVHFVASGAAVASVQKMVASHRKIGGVIQAGLQQVDLPNLGQEAAGTVASHVGRGLQSVAKGVTNAVLLLFFYFFCVRDTDCRRGSPEGVDSAACGGHGGPAAPGRGGGAGDLRRPHRDRGNPGSAGRRGLPGTWRAGALLWSAVTALCCVVPAFGAFLAWVPIALYLGLAQSWTKAALLAAWGGIVVSNVDNVLYPMIVGKKTDLHTAVIFVAIFGGLALFGISGFVLGPVIVAATMFLLGVWKRYVQATA